MSLLFPQFLELSRPVRPDKEEVPVYPHECRRQGKSYSAELRLNIRISLNGSPAGVFEISGGELPVMVLSKACNLSRISRNDYPKHGEEEREIANDASLAGEWRTNACVRSGARTVFRANIYSSPGSHISMETDRAYLWVLSIRAAMRILVRLKDDDYSSQTRALSYLGRLFRGRMHVSSGSTDEEAGVYLLKQFVAIHLDSFVDKYHLLCVDPALEVPKVLNFFLLITIHAFIQQSLLLLAPEIGSSMNYLLATGNLPPSVRANLSPQLGGQSTGLSVPADNVNFLRLAAQFRAIHRGAIFTDMRTTSVRRLLPEAWGFLCPVHTPDGAPCGLLNHLAEPVEAVCETPKQSSVDSLAEWLSTHKLRPVELSRQLSGVTEEQNALPVLLDGRLVGWCSSWTECMLLANELRDMKLNKSSSHVPYSLEIAAVPPTDVGSQYPGLFLFTGASRLLRPVKNVRNGPQNGADLIEWIGTFEQPYLDIAVTEKELEERSEEDRSHMELAPEAIFSFVAGLTPYQDFNQVAFAERGHH
ncbi:unnamed protein product [Echinostoma caproni]|uniref:DNA-directed RNA polymerase n=1 Tax=Echinostoma caproni TaxID=27848 RepID=A0A183B0K2_9TREM|nr:unnamed protein product [Echinostoma caproni]